MIKEINFNGFTTTPSDYESPDGDLSAVMGLVPEDGALKALLPPKTLMTLAANQRVVYIHTTSAFKHYIIHDTSANKLYWTASDGTTATDLRSYSSVIYQVTAIGNTLIVLAADGTHYFLWKGDTDGYLYLGTKMPELPISFGLQGEMVRTDEFSISFDSIAEGDIWNEFSDDNKTKITSQVLAKINKFIADKSTNAGKFIYPFLIRYAYRLYDATLTMHSCPTLMICSSDLAPQVFWSRIKGKGSYTDATLRVVGVLQTLDYAVMNETSLSNLKNWTDIVKSVDIFISKPIYTYDQNGECTKFANVDSSDCYCVCKHTNQAASTTTYPLRYQYNKFSKLYAFTFNPSDFSYPSGRLMIPQRSTDDVKEDIKSCSSFYFLESIKLDQLTTTRTLINIEEDYLQSLVNREVMTDDYDSHDTMIPKYAFVYNQRINLANIKKQLFSGFDVYSLFNYSNGYVVDWSNATPTIADTTQSVSCYVYIKQDGRDIIVQGNSGSVGYKSPLLFFYYPNVNAYKVAIVKYGSTFPTVYEIPLEQHNFLNGSFYFGGWSDLDEKYEVSNVSTISSLLLRTIDIPNKIYTSDVNNPFVFQVTNINTVGTGIILGICSAVKALSQGQFGQFPLYCFSSEGVWALEVSDTGSYSARQPVTRDVCINADSLTQIDGAVLFSTDRGIMLISGSESKCISEPLSGEQFLNIAELPYISDIISKAGFTQEVFTYQSFHTFLTSCRMVYDYTHQHLIVYNPDYTYAYVYSFKSKMWGMMLSDIQDNVNSYPEALAITRNCSLVDFTQSDITTGLKGMFITRPMKLEAPDILKTVDTVIGRGFFKKGNVKMALYGSRDLFNWFLVSSSVDNILRGFSGSPYKYFQLVVVTADFGSNESIYGCSIQYTPRLMNKPR